MFLYIKKGFGLLTQLLFLSNLIHANFFRTNKDKKLHSKKLKKKRTLGPKEVHLL